MTTLQIRSPLKAALLYLFGLLMTLIGGPVASPFLKVFFKQYGAVVYLLSYVVFCVALIFMMPAVGTMMLSFVLSIFIHGVLEKKGVSFFPASLLSLGVPIAFVLTAVLMAAGWSFHELQVIVAALVQAIVDMMVKSGMKADHINADLIVRIFPSVVVSFFVIGLGSAVALERKAHFFFGYHYEKYASQMKPLEFKLPEWMVFVGLISLALAVIGQLTVYQGSENSEALLLAGTIGQNLCIVIATIYFFQGLAILEVMLAVLRAGAFTRFFAYFALVLNLVLVLSAIGFLDYWVDFRKRLRKQTEKQRRMI
jgi:hypothetical protein